MSRLPLKTWIVKTWNVWNLRKFRSKIFILSATLLRFLAEELLNFVAFQPNQTEPRPDVAIIHQNCWILWGMFLISPAWFYPSYKQKWKNCRRTDKWKRDAQTAIHLFYVCLFSLQREREKWFSKRGSEIRWCRQRSMRKICVILPFGLFLLVYLADLASVRGDLQSDWRRVAATGRLGNEYIRQLMSIFAFLNRQ